MMDRYTFSIPDEEANAHQAVGSTGSFTNIQEPLSGLADRGQIREHINRLEAIEDSKDIFVHIPRDKLHHNTFRDREEFLGMLAQKHVPSAFNAQVVTRRAEHNNPNKHEVSQEELHPLSTFDVADNGYDLRQGSVLGDKLRQRINKARYRMADGRTAFNGQYLDSFSSGQEVVARQSKYEAQNTRRENTQQIVREMKALNDIRDINEMPMRSVAIQSQLPGRVERPEKDSFIRSNIRKRQVETGPIQYYGSSTIVQQPYHPPETVIRPTLHSQHPEGRQEITGSITKVERPQIEGFVDIKQRPRVFENRQPNPTDTSLFTGASYMFLDRDSNHTASIMPDRKHYASRAIGAVASNRADYQFAQKNDRESYDVTDSQQQYSSRYAADETNQVLYQRDFSHTQMLNKVVVRDRKDQLLTHRDPLLPFARHVDRPPHGLGAS